jgi:hypothetical protein
MTKTKTEAEHRWPADAIERRAVADLVPYARNPRVHSGPQVSKIAASIQEWGWTTPVLIAEDSTIIAGHGRVLAAQQLGIEEIPCMVARGWTDAQRRAYIIADNQLTLAGDWDEEMMRIELGDIDASGFDLDLIGFDADELSGLMGGFDGNSDVAAQDETYSRKIVAPIYEPKGDKPPVNTLFDDSKSRELVAAIDAEQDLPADVAEFLRHAAQRHTVFHFARIAEFYAHAPPHLQSLMEDSALVIIDFQKAIEGGFVHMTERLGEIADFEEAAADA